MKAAPNNPNNLYPNQYKSNFLSPNLPDIEKVISRQSMFSSNAFQFAARIPGASRVSILSRRTQRSVYHNQKFQYEVDQVKLGQLRPPYDNQSSDGPKVHQDFLQFVNHLSRKIDSNDVISKLSNLRSDLERIKKVRKDLLPGINKPAVQIFMNLRDSGFEQENEDQVQNLKTNLQNLKMKLSSPQNYQQYSPTLKINQFIRYEKNRLLKMQSIFNQTKQLQKSHQDMVFFLDQSKYHTLTPSNTSKKSQKSQNDKKNLLLQQPSQSSHTKGASQASKLPDIIQSQDEEAEQQQQEKRQDSFNKDSSKTPSETSSFNDDQSALQARDNTQSIRNKGTKIETKLVFDKRGITDQDYPAYHLNY